MSGKKGIRRIVLVNPFHVTTEGYDMESVRCKGQLAEPPLGLAYLSAFLKKHGYEVKIFDANLMAIKGFTLGHYSRLAEVENELVAAINDFGPDVVGIGCPFHFMYRTAHRVVEQVKRKMNNVVTVMGGAYPTISPEVALLDRNLDFAILGEGEKPFLKLLEAINGRGTFNALTAIAYRDSTGQPVVKRDFDLLESLDELPMPDRTDLALEDYYRYGRHIIQKFEEHEGKELKLTTITGTRGCPFNCSFCMSRQLWSRRLRIRNPESVLDEIEFLKREHGIEWFSFNDDTILLNRRFSRRLLRGMIERKLDIYWIPVAGMNVRYLDEEMIALAMESGCRMFNLGIESGSPQTLTTIRKPVNIDEVFRVVNMIRKHKNAYIAGFFMLGFPEETEEQFFETVRFGKALACDWNFYACVTPFPGSDLYYEAKANGMLPKSIEDDFEKFHYRSYILNPRYMSNAFVTRESYFANLDQNFFGNPNLRNPERIEIALSDFKHVIRVSPTHASAHYCIGKIYERRGEKDLAEQFYRLAKENLSELHKEYFDRLGISIP